MRNLIWSATLATGALVALSTHLVRADEELKIGVVAAESGSFVSAGNTIVAAANLAQKQINEAGGLNFTSATTART